MEKIVEAIKTYDTESLKSIINSGFDINQIDENGNTSLMISAEVGFIDGIQVLIDAGADKEIVNKKKKTASDVALMNGFPEAYIAINKIGEPIENQDIVNSDTYEITQDLIQKTSYLYHQIFKSNSHLLEEKNVDMNTVVFEMLSTNMYYDEHLSIDLSKHKNKLDSYDASEDIQLIMDFIEKQNNKIKSFLENNNNLIEIKENGLAISLHELHKKYNDIISVYRNLKSNKKIEDNILTSTELCSATILLLGEKYKNETNKKNKKEIIDQIILATNNASYFGLSSATFLIHQGIIKDDIDYFIKNINEKNINIMFNAVKTNSHTYTNSDANTNNLLDFMVDSYNAGKINPSKSNSIPYLIFKNLDKGLNSINTLSKLEKIGYINGDKLLHDNINAILNRFCVIYDDEKIENDINTIKLLSSIYPINDETIIKGIRCVYERNHSEKDKDRAKKISEALFDMAKDKKLQHNGVNLANSVLDELIENTNSLMHMKYYRYNPHDKIHEINSYIENFNLPINEKKLFSFLVENDLNFDKKCLRIQDFIPVLKTAKITNEIMNDGENILTWFVLNSKNKSYGNIRSCIFAAMIQNGASPFIKNGNGDSAFELLGKLNFRDPETKEGLAKIMIDFGYKNNDRLETKRRMC